MANQGCLHIYCGDGKGKTTAATGLAIRAAGSGMSVLFARFLKDGQSAELRILEQIPNIEVLMVEKSFGFYRFQDDATRQKMKEAYGNLWKCVVEKTRSGKYSLLVIDEFMAADRYGLFSHKEALDFFKNRPQKLEIVLTGRDPAADIVDIADYISEIKKIRHPFDCGIAARKGIEF